MPIISEQTLCVSKSPSYAVQASEDCQNLSESAQTSQGPGSYSGETEQDIVRSIPLRGGGFALIDAADYGLVKDHKWVAWNNHGVLYAKSTRNLLMHRLILGIHKAGRTIETDHINRDGLDNRRCNLRVASRSQNLQNRGKFRKFANRKFKGVTPNGQKWRARIYKDGKPILIGNIYPTREAAARAYDERALALFGPHAGLNFPTSTPLTAAA